MASNSSGDNQPKWNAQLFGSAARNALTRLAKDSAKSDTHVQNPTTTSTAQAVNPTQNPTSLSTIPIFETTKLAERIKAPIDFTKSHEGPKFVMLTGHDQGNVSKNYEEASGSSQWEACSDQIEQCIEFIKIQCEHKAVFLVCSGSLGKRIVPQIHHLPQVYAIYVFCKNVDLHKLWAANYAKIRIVCNDDERNLLPQLALDSACFNYELGSGLIEQGKKTEAKAKLERAVKLLEEETKGYRNRMLEKEIRNKLDQCG